MAKKNRQQQQRQKPEEPLGDNWTTPFQDLKIAFEDPPPPPPPPPKPVQQDPPKKERTKEELELLAAFGADDPDSPELNRSDGTRKGPQVSIHKERKGRGGKTVTLVRGLQALGALQQMELLDNVKKDLGTGGRFVDGILELQGDIGQRAAAWFEKNNFKIKNS